MGDIEMNRQGRRMATWTIRWALAIMVAGMVAAPATEAATIRVAKDGSGDFTVVADAVNAAASGDTVTIAPGIYPEVRTFDTPGGPWEYVAEVEIAELTIIGDDRDTVILGPDVPAANLEYGPGGIVTSVTGNVRVRGVTVRNVGAGVWGNDEWLDVEDCRFVGNRWGVAAVLSGFATVRNSEFRDNTDRGVMVFSVRGASGALVENCSFVNNRGGVDFQPLNCVLRDCTFEQGFIGVQISFGGSCRIEKCSFENIDSIGLTITGGAQGYLYDSTFVPPMPINVSVSGLLVGSGNQLDGGSYVTLDFTYNSAIQFTNNHILNGGALTIKAIDGGGPTMRTQDFTNNYWGTTDLAQLDAWVHDSSDAPVVNYIIVDYLPLAEQPIPVESTSFGELKASYGQE
jgi:Right handed beta helix region